MLQLAWFKMNYCINQLHDKARAKGSYYSTDSDRAAQKPADECRGAQKRDAHRTDGEAPDPFGEPHQQRVARPAAERGDHIGVLGIGHDDKPQQHHGDSGPK